jgi:diguanylate cyclase (GGDEF)-like protein/PAS domain S-box-containing protein/putative nucleotidyltransferase with HDIG domain
MRRFRTVIQVCLGLTSIAISVLVTARMFDWLPDRRPAADALRAQGIQAFASGCVMAIQRGDRDMVQKLLEHTLKSVPDLYACQFTTRLGDKYTAGPYENVNESTSTIELPLRSSLGDFGVASFRIRHNVLSEVRGILSPWFLRLVGGFGAVNFVFSFLFLRRILRHLDPSKVVPERVSSTLDTLAEGLVVLDSERHIVMANQAFAQIVGTEADDLVGQALEAHPWKLANGSHTDPLPWVRSLEKGIIEAGHLVRLEVGNGATRTFRVNSAPILDDSGACRGALASFDDLTDLEERNRTLTRMLTTLRASREQIRKQNQELHILATRDPLTSSLNRRSLFRHLDDLFVQAKSHRTNLHCVMADVDHFKNINDTRGHATGDQVLKQVAQILHHQVREVDIVGRYGGEEFCIILPSLSIEEAEMAAERIRHEIAAHEISGLRVTASFGLAGMTDEIESPQQLIDLADKALYGAKAGGRNRVVRVDQITDESNPPSDAEAEKRTSAAEHHSPISFQIVAALTSALAYRDAGTAEHSRRVADLCIMMGRQLMSLSDCYILENAALLHDIGKIGVPDSILLKPGPLNAEEWNVMRAHDRIGIEIIRSTFACEQLTEMVRWHHARYDGVREESDNPTEMNIPLGARIITICDAYDAMVSDRVYRKGLPQTEAINELRRCAGKQFDPDLVEQFISLIEENRAYEELLDPMSLSKQTALRLGVEIEKLAKALDDQDRERLGVLSENVQRTASESGLVEVAQIAEALVNSIKDNDEWIHPLELTIELMEICRQAQRTHLSTAEQPAVSRYVGSAVSSF